MESILNSLKLIKQLFAYLFRNADLLLLTIFLFCVITGLFLFVNNTISLTNKIYLPIILIIATYLIACFLITYYEAVLISISAKRMNAQKASILFGIYNSRRYFIGVLGWSLMLSTIGLMDKLINHVWLPRVMLNFFKQRYYTKKWWISTNSSWNFSSYFVLPFLVMENASLTMATKQSDSLFGPGWQKNFRVSPLIGMCCCITIYLYFHELYIYSVEPESIPSSMHILISLIILLFYVILAVTLNAIEKSALYTSYVLHNWSNDFEQKLLNAAYSRMSAGDEIL